jgi:hypothetical protein
MNNQRENGIKRSAQNERLREKETERERPLLPTLLPTLLLYHAMLGLFSFLLDIR